MTANRFCGACGTPATATDTFCTGCGKPLSAVPAPVPAPTPVPAAYPAPQPAAPPQPAAGGERTLSVIGNLTQVGGFMGLKQKTYSLVVTDRRLVFAELTKDKITAMVNQARDSAKAEGKGFFGQWGAQIGTSFNYHQAYWEMSPDAALAETPGNFAVDRAAFQGAKFKIGITDEQRNTPDEVIIKTASGKYRFTVNGGLGAVKSAFRDAGLI